MAKTYWLQRCKKCGHEFYVPAGAVNRITAAIRILLRSNKLVNAECQNEKCKGDTYTKTLVRKGR